jgi:DNA (cytosine-5)-methyltransferase 1
MGRQDAETETLIPVNRCGFDVAHALRADGFDASEDGTGRGTPLVPVAYQCQGTNVGEMGVLRAGNGNGNETGGVPFITIAFSAKDYGADAGDMAPTLRAGGHAKSHANAGVMPAIAFTQNQRDEIRELTVAGAIAAEAGMKQQTYVTTSAVRRLTPRECERLQGFPDDYTLISHRGKPAADGPRYKALGNSMAVPVMRWIGERIQMVEALQTSRAA